MTNYNFNVTYLVYTNDAIYTGVESVYTVCAARARIKTIETVRESLGDDNFIEILSVTKSHKKEPSSMIKLDFNLSDVSETLAFRRAITYDDIADALEEDN